MFLTTRQTRVLLLGLGLLAEGATVRPVLGDQPAAGPSFSVKLTRRFEISDHRGRLSADGKTLWVEWWDSTGKIKALDAGTGKEVYAFAKEERMFDLSADGRRLTTLLSEFRFPDKPPRGQKEFKGAVRYYSEMKVWDVSNPRAPKELLLIPDAFHPVFAPDGKSLIVFIHEQEKPRSWELWSLEKGKKVADFASASNRDYWPIFSPDGALVAIPGPEAVKLYAAASGAEVRALTHKGSPRLYGDANCVLFARGNANPRMGFAPDGKTLASGGDDGKVKVWEVASGRLTATLAGHSQPYTFVRYSPDGKRLLTGSIGVTEVLRVAPGIPGKGPPVTGKATIIDLSKGEVILWDAATLAKERTLPIRCPVSLSWSADGKILAVGDQSERGTAKPPALQLWDAARGKLLGTWDGFDEGHFTADGRTLLTFNSARMVLWDVQVLPQE